MKIKPLHLIAITFVFVFSSLQQARASGNICSYNGQKFDDRYAKPTNFTGEYSCIDMDTKKTTVREQQVNGVRDGMSYAYDSKTGEMVESAQNRGGKRHGVRKTFRNGKLEQEYAYVNGETRGVQKSYHDGVLERVYLINPDGKMDTEFQLNPSKQLTSLICKKNSISSEDAKWCGRGKQSTVSLYTREGELRETTQYLWGKEHGVQKKFNVKTKAVMSEEHYINGQRQQAGERKFDREGSLLVKSDCDDSRKKCRETEFFPGGKQANRITDYANGKKMNELTYYQNGKPQREIIGDGKKFTITEHDLDGALDSKGTYIEADDYYWQPYLPDGVVETYSTKGDVIRRENYKAGRLEGTTDIYWSEEGHKVHEQLEFKNDVLTKNKVSVDDKPVSESEFMPDGSTKSHRKLSTPPLKDLAV